MVYLKISKKKLNCRDFVIYQKKEKIKKEKISENFGGAASNTKKKKKKSNTRYKILELEGIQAKEGYIYKWIDYNQFEDIPTKIPEGYEKIDLSFEYINKTKCGSMKKSKILNGINLSMIIIKLI